MAALLLAGITWTTARRRIVCKVFSTRCGWSTVSRRQGSKMVGLISGTLVKMPSVGMLPAMRIGRSSAMRK